jgi:hypothetical protein
MRHLMAGVVAGFIAISAVPALGGEIADAASAADELVTAGKFEEAMKALEAAQDGLWLKSPLLFRRALFSAGEPSGFGMYDPRDDNTFKRSEPLIIYAEPMGYGYGREGSLYLISLGLDFVITDTAGNTVASQENFGKLTFRSRFPNKEFMAKVTYDFSKLPVGDYSVLTRARDQYSDKSAEFTLPFKLVD